MVKNIILFSFYFISISTFAQKISIDVAAKHQQIDMIGSDFERSAKHFQDALNPEEIAKWSVGDIPYLAVRVSYDKQQELEEGKKEMSFYDSAIETMKMLRTANPAIDFYATLKSDYNGYGKGNNLPEWICDDRPTTYFHIDKYVAFLADYLELMHNEGLSIKYMTVSKEWSGIITYSRTVEIIDQLAVELPKRGVPIPLYCDPSGWGAKGTTNFVNSIIDMNAQDRFYAFSAHWYDCSSNFDLVLPRFTTYCDACSKAGTSSWDDESGYGQDGSYSAFPYDISSMLVNYSRRAHMYQGGLEGELFFELTSRGQDGENRTIYFTDDMKGVRNITYYVGKKFAENIFLRHYVQPIVNSLASNVYTMSFVSDDEVALWVSNESSTSYDDLSIQVSNTTVQGSVEQYSYSLNSRIQGDYTLLSAGGTNNVKASVESGALNLFVIHLTDKKVDSDMWLSEQDKLDFGALEIEAQSAIPEDFIREFDLVIENPSSDVDVSITGPDAANFSIVENASVTKKPWIWHVPVKVKFTTTKEDKYTANLLITYGGQTKIFPITASSYSPSIYYGSYDTDFKDVTPVLDPITSDVFNDYTYLKGWKIKDGISCVNGAVVLGNFKGRESAYLQTPDVFLKGNPIEVTFKAGMILGSTGADADEQAANDATRNFYAIIGNDTVYDHHKSGNTFGNYATRTFTYWPSEDVQAIKFTSKSSPTDAWGIKQDGLRFGVKDFTFSVTETTKPVVNMGYSTSIDLGQLLIGQSHEFNYNVKAKNLGSSVFYRAEDKANISVSPSGSIPSGGEVNKDVRITIDATQLPVGHYSEKFVVSSNDKEIGERTVYVYFHVVSTISSVQQHEFMHKVIAHDGDVIIKTSFPTDFTVYDLSGRVVKCLHDASYYSFNLPSGIYVISDGKQVKKVVL